MPIDKPVSKALDNLGEHSRERLFPKVRNRGEHWITKMKREKVTGVTSKRQPQRLAATADA